VEGALDPDGRPRTGAQVAEVTRHLRPARDPWPPGMRVIARRERPHPGAQLRLTDAQGWRITLFATNVRGGRIADLEVQHPLRARAEDRIRCLTDTGLRNLPLHDFAANQIWPELVALARGPPVRPGRRTAAVGERLHRQRPGVHPRTRHRPVPRAGHQDLPAAVRGGRAASGTAA
jgi:hypothetical protein